MMNKEESKIYKREWMRQWRKNNPEKAKLLMKGYYQKNKERMREYYKKYKCSYVSRIPRIKMIENKLSWKWFRGCDIKLNINDKNIILGMSFKDFMNYIESKWKLGMSWDNYGSWHIDHIESKSSYPNLTDMEYINKCFHYTNAQPIWAHENYSKGKKQTFI